MIPAKALEKRRCLARFFTSLASVAAFRGAGACLQRNHSPPCQKAKLLTSGRKNRMLYSPIHLHPVFFFSKKEIYLPKGMTLLHTNSIMENARIGGILQGEKDFHPILHLLLIYSPLPQLLSPVHRSVPVHILRTDIHKYLCRLSWNEDRYSNRTDRIPEYLLR